MEKKITKENHMFTIKTTDKGLWLSYDGRINDFPQGCIWYCYDESEAMDMIEAVIDPERYADDEWRMRHNKDLMSMCRW